MPSLSREKQEHLENPGPAEEQSAVLGGQHVNFVTLHQDMDIAPLLVGLPDDRCPCTHLGYLFAGAMTCVYPDREETYRAGDAYVMEPGHTARAVAGTHFLQITPADQYAVMDAAVQRNLAALSAT